MKSHERQEILCILLAYIKHTQWQNVLEGEGKPNTSFDVCLEDLAYNKFWPSLSQDQITDIISKAVGFLASVTKEIRTKDDLDPFDGVPADTQG